MSDPSSDQSSAEEPVVVVFLIAEQDVEVMVAKNALCRASFYQRLHASNDCRAVGAAVSQVAEKDEAAPIRMHPVGAVAELPEKVIESANFAVNIPDNVERAIEQRTHKRISLIGPVHRCRPVSRSLSSAARSLPETVRFHPAMPNQITALRDAQTLFLPCFPPVRPNVDTLLATSNVQVRGKVCVYPAPR